MNLDDPIDDELMDIDMNVTPPATPPRQMRPLNSPVLQRRGRLQREVPLDLGPPIQMQFPQQPQEMTQQDYNNLLARFPVIDVSGCGYEECPIMYSDLTPNRTVRLSDRKCYSFEGIAGLDPNNYNLRSPMNNTPLNAADRDIIRNLRLIMTYEREHNIGGRKRRSSRRRRKTSKKRKTVKKRRRTGKSMKRK